MARFSALFDSSVLFSSAITSLVLEAAREEIFRARWSAHIHEEWVRNLIKKRPNLDPAGIQRRRDKMDEIIQDALVTGYEGLIDCGTPGPR